MRAWRTSVKAVHPLSRRICSWEGDIVFADTRKEAWQVLKATNRGYMRITGLADAQKVEEFYLINPN